MTRQIEQVYRVGDSVKLRLGSHDVIATIIEDRGFIGRDGGRIVRVLVEIDPPYSREFDVPVAWLQPVSPLPRLL